MGNWEPSQGVHTFGGGSRQRTNAHLDCSLQPEEATARIVAGRTRRGFQSHRHLSQFSNTVEEAASWSELTEARRGFCWTPQAQLRGFSLPPSLWALFSLHPCHSDCQPVNQLGLCGLCVVGGGSRGLGCVRSGVRLKFTL